MTEAILLAEKAGSLREVPVGAVITHEGRIVGRGYNQVETLGDPTAHAEMLAITAACETLGSKYLTGCTLYVTLEPCPMCAGALVWSKLDRIVFAAMDAKAGACGSVVNLAHHAALNHRIQVHQGLFETDCEHLLSGFFAKLRA
jgi:tRNA(adenine34) deaminase